MEALDLVIVVGISLVMIFGFAKNFIFGNDINENITKDAKLEQQQEDKQKEISDLKDRISQEEENQKNNINPEDFWSKK